MTMLAPTLEAFFTERLVGQRQASPNTVAAYRDAWRLLLGFASQRLGKAPYQLDIAELDGSLIGAFLDHLETERHNSARTRNARLAAIRSFFAFASLRHPEHAGLIARVLAIPTKRWDRAEVSYLTDPEADAVVASPDPATWTGRRDHALLALALQTGLRVSELTGLRNRDVEVSTGACVRCWGKGRKQRATPLRPRTKSMLRAWMKERRGGPDDLLFPTCRDTRLSTDAVEALVDKHARAAAAHQPSLRGKNVTPHTLRHSCVPWHCVVAGWIGRQSPCGSGTSMSAPPTSTSMLTWRSKSVPSPAPGRSTSGLGATGRPTGCSPSCRTSDYADGQPAHLPPTTHKRRHHRDNQPLGIIDGFFAPEPALRMAQNDASPRCRQTCLMPCACL